MAKNIMDRMFLKVKFLFLVLCRAVNVFCYIDHTCRMSQPSPTLQERWDCEIYGSLVPGDKAIRCFIYLKVMVYPYKGKENCTFIEDFCLGNTDCDNENSLGCLNLYHMGFCCKCKENTYGITCQMPPIVFVDDGSLQQTWDIRDRPQGWAQFVHHTHKWTNLLFMTVIIVPWQEGRADLPFFVYHENLVKHKLFSKFNSEVTDTELRSNDWCRTKTNLGAYCNRFNMIFDKKYDIKSGIKKFIEYDFKVPFRRTTEPKIKGSNLLFYNSETVGYTFIMKTTLFPYPLNWPYYRRDLQVEKKLISSAIKSNFFLNQTYVEDRDCVPWITQLCNVHHSRIINYPYLMYSVKMEYRRPTHSDCVETTIENWQIFYELPDNSYKEGHEYLTRHGCCTASIPPYTFDPGVYLVRFTMMHIKNGEKVYNFQECVLPIYNDHIQAHFNESVRVVNAEDSNEVRVEAKDINKSEEKQKTNLDYTWSCKFNETDHPCPKVDKYLKNSPYFDIPPNILIVNTTYNFTVRVACESHPKGKEDTSTATSQKLVVTTKVSDLITLMCATCDDSNGMNPQEYNVITIRAKDGESAPLPADYVWTFAEAPGRDFQPVETIKEENGTSYYVLRIKKDVLEHDKDYVFRVARADDDKVFAEITVRTPALEIFLQEEFNCTLNPTEGISGWTDFDLECFFEEAYLFFEFYDKDENDTLLFGGRMLGYNMYGVLSSFKMTKGKFLVLAFDRHTVRKNLTLMVHLERFNDTLTYLEGLNSRAKDLVSYNTFDWPAATVSSVADVMGQEMNPPTPTVKDPVLVLNRVIIGESLGLVKMVLASLKVILENTDKKFEILELDAYLTKTAATVLSVTALKLLEREKNIKLESALPRSVFFNMIKVILDCAELLLEQKNRHYRSRLEEYVIPVISDLVQDTSNLLVYVLETVSYSLNIQQIIGDHMGEILSERTKLLAITKADFTKDLGNWTRISSDSSVIISNEVVSSFENTTQLLGLQYILIRINPFWWVRRNIVTEIILVNFCIRKKNIDCQQTKYFKTFINIHLRVIEPLENVTTFINGTAYQVDPETAEDTKELELTVYRFFLPERAKFFLKFSLDKTQSYRVMLTKGLRPDYASMVRYAQVINDISPNYNVSYDNKHESARVYFLGILPEKTVSIGQISPFSLKAYYSLCTTWVRWHWTSFGCWVGSETSEETMQCDCNHLSVIGGVMATPDHDLNSVTEFMLYLTAWENLMPLYILLFILLLYLLLLIWAIMKDRKDRREGEVIVLDDNFPGERYAYLLGVYTGSRICSSTSAIVGVRVFGESDDSRAHILRSPERGVMNAFSEDWFLIYTRSYLGKLRRLWLWHNDGGFNPDWFVEKIEVFDLQTKVQYIFEVNSWVAIDVDAYPDIFLAPVKVNHYFCMANVFRNNLITGVRDTHYWTSVCLKHSRSPISRVDRVSVIVSFVVSAMAVCLLLYLFYFGFDIDEDKPSYYLIHMDILIFIVTLLIASILAFIVMGLYRRSFTHKYKVFMTPRTFKISHVDDGWTVPNSFHGSEDDEFTTVREADERQSRYETRIRNKRFRKFGFREKPRHLRNTRENCAFSVRRIMQGTPLLPLRLPGSKSDLIVRKPWFLAAWLLCIITILTSTIIIVSYAWKLPTVKDDKFLTTFLGVLVFDVVIMSFLKILIFSAVLSFMFKNVLPGNTYHIRIKNGARMHLFGKTSFLAELLQTRKKRIYYPLLERVKEKKMRTKTRKYRWRILIEFIMLLFLVLVISMICKIYYIDRYLSNTHATRMITTNDNIFRLAIKQVLNRTDYLNYLEYTYVGRIYKFMWYNYEPLMNPESPRKDWTSDCVMRLLGNTRIRQLRVSQENCSMESMSDELCAPTWSEDEENKDVYSTSWLTGEYEDTRREKTTWRYTEKETSNSSNFYGQSGTLYHGGGYIAELGYSRRETRGTLIDLGVEGWLDHVTRVVFVELNLYNVNTDLFTQVVLVTEQMPTGQYISLPKVESASIVIDFDLWNISFIVFQVIFLLKALYFMNRRGLFTYFTSILNKYELFLLVLGFTTVVVYVIHIKTSSLYVEEYRRKGLDEFFSFFEIIRYDFISKSIMCFLFICVVYKLLLSWKFGRIYFSFYYTFLLSLPWIVWLTLYFTTWLIILWRFLGYNLNVYIFSYYSIAIIYSKDFKITGVHTRVIEHLIVYIMCILSSFVITMFIASFAHYYRVGKYYRLFYDRKLDNFNYGIFFKKELKRLAGRKDIDE